MIEVSRKEIAMRNLGSKNTVKDWTRLIAKWSLLLTAPRVLTAISDQLKDRADDVADTVAGKYDDAVDRLRAAKAALNGRSNWSSRTTGFLLGVGVGAGLGILLAPSAGIETREAIRGKAVDVKNKVVDSASSAVSKMRNSITSMPSTGTEG